MEPNCLRACTDAGHTCTHLHACGCAGAGHTHTHTHTCTPVTALVQGTRLHTCDWLGETTKRHPTPGALMAIWLPPDHCPRPHPPDPCPPLTAQARRLDRFCQVKRRERG